MKSDTIKRYEELGLRLAEILRRPENKAAVLELSLAGMAVEPPSPPRSVNRKKSTNGPLEWVTKAGAWAAKYPEMSAEFCGPAISQAAADGTLAEAFEAMAKGARKLSSKAHPSRFARHVICAMQCAIRIMTTENRMPTKQEIKTGVKSVFKKMKWIDFWGKGDDSRWTEVFNAADLSDLPRGKNPPKIVKHGEHSTTKRIRISRHRYE